MMKMFSFILQGDILKQNKYIGKASNPRNMEEPAFGLR